MGQSFRSQACRTAWTATAVSVRKKSLYTAALNEILRRPDIDVLQAFNEVGL
jgi:hypothetical protein